MSSSILGFYVLAHVVHDSSNARVSLTLIKRHILLFLFLLLILALNSFLLYLSVQYFHLFVF